VLLSELACRRVGWDGMSRAAQPNSAALRLSSEPPGHVASWRVCMVWGTNFPCVIAGKLVRRGDATFASWSEAGTARANERLSEARRRLLV
jgi:hypothetical protein